MAVLCLSALGTVFMSSPASAHAVLESASPSDGAVVAKAPTRVTLTFDEPVGVSSDSLRVFGPNGARVDTGSAANGSKPAEVTIALRSGLGHGTFTVSWHVISADSHPVQGAYTFSIGAPSSTVVNQATLLLKPNHLVNFAFWLVRWLAFACFALLSGAITFVIWFWPAGFSRRSVLRLAMGAWGGLAVATLGAIMLQGIYGTDQGFGHLFFPNVLHATLHSGYGRALGIRLLLVIAALFVFTVTLDGLQDKGIRERRIAGIVWGALTAGLAVTWGIADHAGTGIQVPLALPADTLHLSAMVTWIGGLVMLVTIVLRPAPVRAAGSSSRNARNARNAANRKNAEITVDAAQAVMRFSPIALDCVICMIVTGTYLAWREVGLSFGALFSTAYGQLLIAKIVGLSALIGLGYLARLRIANGLKGPVAALRTAEVSAPAKAGTALAGTAKVKVGAATNTDTAARGGRSRAARNGANGRGGRAAQAGNGGAVPADPGPDLTKVGVTLRQMRISVTVETIIAMVVLAIAAVLVNTPTARESYFPTAHASTTFNTGGQGGSGTISVTVTPARPGDNQLQISVSSADGKPYRPQQLQASLVMPANDIGPLPVRLTPDGAGKYTGGPATISNAGQWQVRILIRSDAFDEATVTLPVTVH